MAEIYQGSTPTITVKLPSAIDLSNAIDVYVSFARGDKTFLTVKNPTVAEHKVIVFLTQEESLMFPPGDVQIQLNWTFSDGEKVLRHPTEIGNIRIRRNLYDKVM